MARLIWCATWLWGRLLPMRASMSAQPVPSMIEPDQEAVLGVKPDRR